MPMCSTCMCELMRIEVDAVFLALKDPVLLYPFIESMETEVSACMFIAQYAQVKCNGGESFGAESLRIARHLQDKHGVRSLNRIPCSKTRECLTQIWSVHPNSIPPHLLRNDGLLRLSYRWLSTSSTPSSLLRILKKIKDEVSGIDFNVKIISLFLVTPNQLAIPLLDQSTLPAVLYSFMEQYSESELLSLWADLISQPLVSCEGIFSVQSFSGSKYPHLLILNLVFRIITKLLQKEWKIVSETLLRMLCSKLAHPDLLKDTCEEMAYLVRLDCPGRVLSSLLTIPDLVPVIENILTFAETVFNRFCATNMEDLEFLSALIKLLQTDILRVQRGFEVSSIGALEIARLSSLKNTAAVQSAMMASMTSVLPSNSGQFLFTPVAPIQPNFTQQVFLPPSGPAAYSTGDGVEVAYRTDSFCGIQNFNNTCYLSSFLQALFFTDAFTCSVYGFGLQQLGKTEEKDFTQGLSIVKGLKLLFARMLKTNHKYVEISEFIRSLPPTYRSGEQQDVTESGRWMFDKLGGTEQPLVQSVFGGELVHKTKCLNCQTVTERKEVFTDLCVSVPKESEVLGKKRVTVQGLIKQMLKPEQLTGDNKYCCSTCGETKQDATRWIEILQFPTHLIVVMHKFSFDIATCDFKKEKTVVYPENIQLVGHPYELYGSVLHYGETATKGHYVALCKRSALAGQESKWALVDDTSVDIISQSEAEERMSGLRKATDAAYVLFFKSTGAPFAPNPRIPAQIIDEALAIEAAAVHL